MKRIQKKVRSSKKKQHYTKKKILIISRYPIKKKNDYRYFFISECEDTYELINLSYNNYFVKNNHKQLIKDLNSILSSNKISLFIDLIFHIDTSIKNNSYRNHLKFIYEIRKIINSHKIKSIKFIYSWLSKWSVRPWVFFHYGKYLYKIIQNLFLEKIYKYPHSDYICITGGYGKFEVFKFGIKKIFFPHFDFLIHNLNNHRNEKLSFLKNKKFIVYLDQNIQFSHDRKIIKIKRNFSTLEEELDKYFTLIKKKFNLEIIVASHPKRDLKRKTILTKKWKVIKGYTSDLVKRSEAVIAHDSMSINYAVLNLKPLIFLTTDQLNQSDLYSHTISIWSKYFKKEKINISDPSQDLVKANILNINKSVYKKYKNDFILPKENFTLDFRNLLKKIIQ